jgi:hypothetical protein
MAKAGNREKQHRQKRFTKKSTRKGEKIKPETAAAALDNQPCLTLSQAAFIVGGCLPSGSHGPDDTLEEAGLISENLRLIFRECVFNGVDREGCEIDRGQIPNDADMEIGDVVRAVFENARTPSE